VHLFHILVPVGGGAVAPICPPPWRRYWNSKSVTDSSQFAYIIVRYDRVYDRIRRLVAVDVVTAQNHVQLDPARKPSTTPPSYIFYGVSLAVADVGHRPLLLPWQRYWASSPVWTQRVYQTQAVGRKFLHKPGNPATVGVVRWPSAGDTAGYCLRRPNLTPVSVISMKHTVVADTHVLYIHCVSKKTRHQTLAHNFPKC